MSEGLKPGIVSTVYQDVGEEHTARRLGSGDVEVLGTPAVLALVERAASEAIASKLEDDATSVGTRVELEHVAATAPGDSVRAEVRIESIEGRLVRFSFEVTDSGGVVATGTHERVIVERQRFLDRAASRRAERPAGAAAVPEAEVERSEGDMPTR